MDELVKELKVPMDKPLELVVLAVKKSAMRCKVVASGDRRCDYFSQSNI